MGAHDNIREFVLAGHAAKPVETFKDERLPSADWAAVQNTGTQLWLDTGDLRAARDVWDADFKALTTNNSLLNQEVQSGRCDALIQETIAFLRSQAGAVRPVDRMLEINFVLTARHALKLAAAFDARVSVELHTDLANDVERSVETGRRFHEICPDHFYIKIPFTPAGLIAARRLGDEQIPVNLTLGFSARQNFLAAQFARPAYVNVFLGRLNAFVQASGLGGGEGVGEKTVRATQRMLRALRESGRSDSFLIAASMRSAQQVSALAGVDVMTLPVAVAQEYAQNPAKDPADRMNEDLHVPLLPGFTTADFNGDTLWETGESFEHVAQQLCAVDSDSVTPESLMEHFQSSGFSDFLPAWTVDEIDAVMLDGKIPDFKKWRPRLQAGELGLDALMNVSALTAFVTDQKALDERIRSFL